MTKIKIDIANGAFTKTKTVQSILSYHMCCSHKNIDETTDIVITNNNGIQCI